MIHLVLPTSLTIILQTIRKGKLFNYVRLILIQLFPGMIQFKLLKTQNSINKYIWFMHLLILPLNAYGHDKTTQHLLNWSKEDICFLTILLHVLLEQWLPTTAPGTTSAPQVVLKCSPKKLKFSKCNVKKRKFASKKRGFPMILFSDAPPTLKCWETLHQRDTFASSL